MAGKQLDQATKDGAVDDVRNGGLSVAGAAAKWGVSSKTIYNWLRAEVADGGRSLLLENKRLRKELEQAYRLLGRATAELKRQKKIEILRSVPPGLRRRFCQALGVPRSSFYKRLEPNVKDAAAIARLQAIHLEHPFYGVRRLALCLGWSINRTRRIRNLAGVVAATASKRRRYPRSGAAQTAAPGNPGGRYAVFRNADRPQDGQDYTPMTKAAAWVQDFTHLRLAGGFCYLAAVMDLRCRRIVGRRLGGNHGAELIRSALLDALSKHERPAILHSGQGSEYLSYRLRDLCQKLEVQLSCSSKGSPWQNGFVERWFGQFKLELGNASGYKDVAELHEAVALGVHYYNHRRIHLALKTTPAAYAATLDKVFTEKGA